MSAEKLAEALRLVREIIVDGAKVGFDCHSGDWADRLFKSQHLTREALAAHSAEQGPRVCGGEQWLI